MDNVFTKMQLDANDQEDMVVIRLGDLRPFVPYQIAFEIEQSLRMGCKQAARFDRVPGTFWPDIVGKDDPRLDAPKPHQGFRRSNLTSNVTRWEVRVNPPLVGLVFDGLITEMGYEEGIRLHDAIRRAGLRAKAWAGDTQRRVRVLGALSDSENDYRLGTC